MQSANDSKSIFLTIVLLIFLFAEVFSCAPQSYRARSQPCNSSEETFFNEQCLGIGSFKHCPNNMRLFDGPNNEGFCDCEDITGRLSYYSDKTGECSYHNTQGPCLEHEWFVLKKGIPKCERVPEGCPADGQHFYGSTDETMAKQCWELWTQGPCPPNEILLVEERTGELKIRCGYRLSASSIPYSAGYLYPCRPGTRRNRFGHCNRGFH